MLSDFEQQNVARECGTRVRSVSVCWHAQKVTILLMCDLIGRFEHETTHRCPGRVLRALARQTARRPTTRRSLHIDSSRFLDTYPFINLVRPIHVRINVSHSLSTRYKVGFRRFRDVFVCRVARPYASISRGPRRSRRVYPRRSHSKRTAKHEFAPASEFDRAARSTRTPSNATPSCQFGRPDFAVSTRSPAI